MPNTYIGPGWENPERKRIFGGSLADVYVRDGFTVASIVEPGFSDTDRVQAGKDIAVYRPDDEHRTTPMTWVGDLAAAEEYISTMRANHPEWPTEPVPLLLSIPEFTTPREAIESVLWLSQQLDGLDLHGYPSIQVARWMFLYGGKILQNRYVNQAAVDHAYSMAQAAVELSSLTDDAER